MTDRPLRILIADDETLLRNGLRAMLEHDDAFTVVAEAGDGAEAVEATLRHHPDVVLMDVRMPNVDGIEAIRRLRAAASPARILVITTFDVDEHVHEAMEAGAVGYLLKDASMERLTEAVRQAARGDTVMDPAITRRLVTQFLARPNPDHAARDRLGELTEREVEVLKLMARGHSNADLAEQLFLSEGTVKTHVTRLLGKLGLKSRLQAVVLAYEVGLVRPGEAPPPG